MSKKTLSEVYGYSRPTKKAKKLSSNGLRSVILNEIRSVLREQEEDKKDSGPVDVEGLQKNTRILPAQRWLQMIISLL